MLVKSVILKVPFLASLRFSFGLVLALNVVLGVMDIFQSHHKPSYMQAHPWQTVEFMTGLAIVLAGLLYLMFIWYRARVNVAGVYGRSYFGFKSYISWADLVDMRARYVYGIPALVLRSGRGTEIWLYHLGLRTDRIQQALIDVLGHNHQFIEYFE